MASGEPDSDLDIHQAETTAPTLPCGMTNRPTLPEAQFGLGISDPSYQQQTWSGMGKLFQQETLSDVMLMAEGHSIACHKFLLAAASEYFYNRLAVDNDSVNHNLLEIEGISFNALKVIVSYLYTGNINITQENASDVMPVCKMLQLKSAYDICVNFTLDTVNPGNCIGLYKMAKTNDVQQLLAKTLDMMESNFTEVVSGREFLTMSEQDLADYIQNENVNILNEDPVFEAVVSWVRSQPLERECSFARLITHVRLTHCSPHYLTQVVSKEPLMNSNECQKLLVAALVHHTAAASPDSNKPPDTAPRKGYARETTLMIIGGKYEPGNVIGTNCWRLGAAGWRVMEQCPVPAPVWCFSACMMKEGILLSGGFRDGKPVGQCWLLSTSTYQWSPLPDLNTPRGRHASVCVGGQPYVIDGQGSDGKEISSVECLHRFSGKWDILPDLPKRLVHPMSVSHGHYIYVFGGTDIKWNHSHSVYVYGTNRNLWQTLADMPHICKLGSAVVWKDRIYIVGGFDQACMCYDPVLAQWSTLSQCRHEHADGPALVWKDRILVCGGRTSQVKRDDGAASGTTVIEEYNPETDTWTVSQTELPLSLHAHCVFNTDAGIKT